MPFWRPARVFRASYLSGTRWIWRPTVSSRWVWRPTVSSRWIWRPTVSSRWVWRPTVRHHDGAIAVRRDDGFQTHGSCQDKHGEENCSERA
jgi:hypothetical protein